jgi:C-terminal processing protease CtpA/Prc
VTRGALAILASACLTVAGVRAASTRAPDVAQDWRTAAVASFDAAWQAINDTFPDPRFGGVDWPAVARELRPRVEAAGTPDEARDVIREMLARLKRSHFVLLSATADTVLAGPASIPVDVRMLNGEAVVTRVTDTAAGTAGLHAGQVLVSIDDVGVASKIRVAQGSDQRTRDLEAWRHLNQLLSGLEKSEATVSVREVDGSARTLRVTRTMAAGETVTLGNLPPLRVAFEQHKPGHRPDLAPA